MDASLVPDNPYLLLTPGPLSTSKRVRAALFRDWCTWDDDYNRIVEDIRRQLAGLASATPGYSSVLMQGSGTFAVESVIGSMVPPSGRVLFLTNGVYGQRMVTIARTLGIDHLVQDVGERAQPDLDALDQVLAADSGITHVAVVHCETTTGMLNPLAPIGAIVRRHGRSLFVDAMSSFGGIPLDMAELGIDFLVSSANKCIQGVPGFGFIVARREAIEACAGNARSVSLDLHAQWRAMEDGGGKWRFTSPTHSVRAFAEALAELADEGGIAARWQRYQTNHRVLVQGMAGLGFRCLLPPAMQSPIITAFLSPEASGYRFATFYERLKAKGFVIYPGKVTDAETFRIGNIGHVFPADMEALITAVADSMTWTSSPV